MFLHEWLHQLEAFYREKGVRLPKGGLHGAGEHGYKSQAPEFWRPWYRDFMNGAVREGDELAGLGEDAWKFGTIRQAAMARPYPPPKPPAPIVLQPPRDYDLSLSPSYLNKKRRRQANLLKNLSFEAGDAGWECRSWKGNRQAAQIDSSAPHQGKQCVCIAAQGDDVQLVQRVQLKPYKSYLFSGWARTENLMITEQGGTVCRRNLSTTNLRGEHSQTLVGTNRWTYVLTMFYTGDKTDIELAARLGHNGSTVTGTAWFDDLCLIEFPNPE